MNLRPHHILCIQNFTGHGYDAAFTARMTDIVSVLKNTHNARITVTEGCDDLCEICPNNTNGVCTSLEKVTRMDKAVLDICGLVYGENVRWQESADSARKRIFETDAFHNICACCQWFTLCREVRDEQ